MSPRADPRRRLRLGLRREVLILLPVALLLLAVLSTFTLFAYRSAISLLVDERRDEAASLARVVANGLLAGAGAVPSSRGLRELAPGASLVALLDDNGRPLSTVGEPSAVELLAPLHGRRLREPQGVGPDADLPDSVAGFAPLLLPAGRRIVRVDLPARVLASQRLALTVLTVLVLGVESALLLLVLLFLRRLLTPYDTLLARAKELGVAQADPGDEVEFLLATFDRALRGLVGDEERRGEEDIAALERTLSASLQSGLLVLDREGRVLALNPVGAALLGLAVPEPGLPYAELLAGQPELREILAALVSQGEAPKRLECSVRAAGEVRTVGLTAHPLRRNDGAVRGYLVLFADLTDVLRQAEESRLAASLADLGELAGGVAHELRNSLATLRGYLTLIERRPGEETIADFLQEIRREADHLQRVLEDFLSFARPGTARVQELSLAALLLRAAADPVLSGIEVLVAAPHADPAILRGDPQLLERAVRNLLHNAAEAEREAGRAGPVEVRLERSAEGVEVWIDDRGRGLAPKIRPRLFHPFATTRPGGAGLGLALAQRIVLLHGGRIRLEDRPGGGVRARLFLPCDTDATEGSRSGEEAAPGAELEERA